MKEFENNSLKIKLPDNQSYLDFSSINLDILYKATEDRCLGIITSCKWEEVEEIIKWCDKNDKQLLNDITKFILIYFSEESSRSSYLGTYQLKLKKEVNAELEIYKPRIEDKGFIAYIALQNGNMQMVDNIFREVLTNAKLFLQNLMEDDFNDELVNLHIFIRCIKPEYQNHFILKYQEYFIQHKDIAVEVCKTLIHNNALNDAKNLIQTIPEEIIKFSDTLQFFEVWLCPNEFIIHKINDYNVSENIKAELYFNAAIAGFNVDNLKFSLLCLSKALELAPENQDYIQTNLLLETLNNPNKLVGNHNKDKREEALALFLKDEINIEKATYLGEELDPKKIHKSFQLLKKQKLNNLSNSNNESIGWKITKDITISNNKVIDLGEYKGLQHYGYIDPKLQNLGLINKFNQALEKGFVYRKKGQNGVKPLKGNAFEIKIDDDDRLLTNIIHVNKNKELLIIFDHEASNHNAITKFVGEHKIMYEDCLE